MMRISVEFFITSMVVTIEEIQRCHPTNKNSRGTKSGQPRTVGVRRAEATNSRGDNNRTYSKAAHWELKSNLRDTERGSSKTQLSIVGMNSGD